MADLIHLVEDAISLRSPRREGPDELNFLCPAHEETTPSASWNRKKEAWFCQVCGTGGGTRDLAERLGIPIEKPRERAQKGRIVQTYDYIDENGRVLYQVVRFEPKDFRQRRPDGKGDWVWNLSGTRLVPYQLPDLIASSGRVYIAEGEKDVEAIRARGRTATCNAMGAVKTGRSKWYPDQYNQWLAEREVVLLPDNDAAGINHANYVAQSLGGTASSIRILHLPGLPDKGDVSDWFAAGGTIEDLDALADAAAEWQAPKAPTGLAAFPTTDAGNGELFAHLYGNKARYDHLRGRWLLWQNHRWQVDPNGELQRMAKEAARARLKDATDIDDAEIRKGAVKWSIQSEANMRLNAMLTQAKSEHPIADTGEGWDSNPLVLGTENGVINLTTGGHRAGRIEERITLSCGLTYDANATCPRWIQFLSELFLGDESLVAFIQRAVGYTLTGSVKEQVWFLCHGSGSNGKSTFLNIITALGGQYSGDTPAETLTKKAGLGGSIPTDVAALSGKRIVTCSETEELHGINAARVKQLTGNNPVTARFLHKDFFTFIPQLKLWLSTNHLPRVDDDSDGFWRRVRLIPFERSFEGEERDNDIEDRLRKELPGILNWAVAGAVEWHKHGLQPPTKVMLATLNYRISSDPLAEFITDCCVVGEYARATRGELYEAYKGWAKRQGYSEREMIGARSFGRRIDEKYPNVKGTGGVRWYRGIGIRENAENGDLPKTPENSGVTDDGVAQPHLSVSDSGFLQLKKTPRMENPEVTPLTPLTPLACGCEEKHTDELACNGELYWQDAEDRYHCPVCHREEAV